MPHQLPADIAAFTGRAAELRRLAELLAPQPGQGQGPVVVCAINGMAGIGKSALAVHAAHQLGDRFPDGQLYLDLRGATPGLAPLEPIAALEQLLGALGVPFDHIPAELDRAAAQWRSLSAERRLLVLLDNAASAAQAVPLLPGSPSCAVLVTCRRMLTALDGARHVPLDVLAPAEAVDLLARLADRARVDAEHGAAAEVARLCGYLPLALRLAGARAARRPTWPLARLAARLAQARRLDELHDEHVGVRASFQVSYQALDASPDRLDRQAARAFRLLGTLDAPDVSGAAAACLLGLPELEAERVLERLLDAQLLHAAAAAATATVSLPPVARYRLHDLLRIYAAERAAAQEADRDRDAALRRVLAWYLRTADAADRVLDPTRPRIPIDLPGEPGAAEDGGRPLAFTSHSHALGWCEDERANLVAATGQAARIGWHQVAWQLPMALFGFFYLRKPWNDWTGTFQIGLAAAQQSGNLLGEAATLTGLGVATYDLRQLEQAIGYLRRALGLCRQLQLQWGEGLTLMLLGAAYRDCQPPQPDAAVGCLGEAQRIWQLLGDQWGQGVTLHNLADTYRILGRFDEALDCLQQALALRRKLDDRYGEAWTLHDLGTAYQDLQRFDEAMGCFEQALALRRQVGDRHGEARTLRRIGDVLHATGHPDDARQAWQQAMLIFRQLGDPRGAAIATRLGSLAPATPGRG